MKKLLVTFLLFAAACDKPSNCKEMCDKTGVLLYHANSHTCICQVAK